MKNTMIALAAISALTLGAFTSAEARDQGRGHGAQRSTHAPARHQSAPVNAHHGSARMQARRHAPALAGRAHPRADRRFHRVRGNHYRVRPGHWRARRVHRSLRWRHRPGPWVYHAYPVYQSPSRSLGLDIETDGFRFSVNKSE